MKTANGCKLEKKKECLLIRADKETDYFIDLLNNYQRANAPFYYQEVDYNFEIKVCIRPTFKATYDAGAIVVDDQQNWIKAAFEATDLGYPSVVSVVTKTVSDDCNGEKIEQESVWIRILRQNDYWAIHYSLDGAIWKMVRYFRLNLNPKLKVGIIAQSPQGDGCEVEFSNLEISENSCNDLRKGK